MTVMVKLEPARVIVERERRERVMKNEISRSWFEREKREEIRSFIWGLGNCEISCSYVGLVS